MKKAIPTTHVTQSHLVVPKKNQKCSVIGDMCTLIQKVLKMQKNRFNTEKDLGASLIDRFTYLASILAEEM
jgi:hypothetical protein